MLLPLDAAWPATSSAESDRELVERQDFMLPLDRRTCLRVGYAGMLFG